MVAFPDTFSVVPAFPTACTPSAVQVVVADQLVPGSSMKFDQVTMDSFNEMPPNSGHYLADFVIGFKNYIIKPRDVRIPIEFTVDVFSGTAATRPFTSCNYNGPSAVSISNCSWTAFGCGAVLCPTDKIQVGMETQGGFNEDCGGGGNDYDEPSRRLFCCDIN